MSDIQISDSEEEEVNPNDFAKSRSLKKQNPTTNSSTIPDISLEAEIRRGNNIPSYLNHIDKTIRKKAKNIYNKIHGSGAHLQYLAEAATVTNQILTTPNMELINQLQSENESLRDQLAAINQTNILLNNTVSQLSDTIGLLRNELIEIKHNLTSQLTRSMNSSDSHESYLVDETGQTIVSPISITRNNLQPIGNMDLNTQPVLNNTNNQSFANTVRKNVSNIDKQTTQTKPPTFKFSKTITPIICPQLDGGKKSILMAQMNQSFGKKIVMFNTGASSVKINSDTTETRKQVIEMLKLHHYEFHTFCPDNERRVDIVIRGLPYDGELFTVEYIINAVREWGYSPISARIINRPRNNENPNSTMVNWHVSLPHNTSTEELFGKKIIHQCVVTVETLKKRPVTQCYRCLQFHHTAAHCFKQQKCLICTGNHKAGNCDQPRDLKPKCINCNGDHAATNLKKCSYFHDLAERSKLAREANGKSIAENIVQFIQTKTQPKQKQSRSGPTSNKDDTMLPSSTPAKLPVTSTPKKKPKSTPESSLATSSSTSTGLSSKSASKPKQKKNSKQSLQQLIAGLITQQQLILQHLNYAA